MAKEMIADIEELAKSVYSILDGALNYDESPSIPERNRLRVDGKPINIARLLDSLEANAETEDEIKVEVRVRKLKNNSSAIKTLIRNLENLAKTDIETDSEDGEGEPMSEELKAMTLNYSMKPPKDGRRSMEYFLTTPEDVPDLSINVDAWLKLKGIKSVDHIKSRAALLQYEPRKPIGVFDYDEKQIPIINSYVLPPYRTTSVPAPASLHESIARDVALLVDHLFPLPIEREFFWDWVYMSLFGRAQTYLVLCGKPGIGKTTLRDILKGLHGFQNSVDGKKSTLTDKFNAQLSSCTLIWFDELKYSDHGEAMDNLKQNQNDTVAIEAKGVDSTKGEQIFASMVISNNYVSHNAFSYEDRKFAPLVLTEKRLEESLSPGSIHALKMAIREYDTTYNPELLATIYEWLKLRGFKGTKWSPGTMEYYGPMFYSMCQQNMSYWARGLFDTIQTKFDFGDKIKFSEIERSVRKFFRPAVPRNATVFEFLNRIHDYRGKKVFNCVLQTHPSNDVLIEYTAPKDSFCFDQKVFSDIAKDEDLIGEDIPL